MLLHVGEQSVVVLKITRRHKTHRMKVRCEDVCVFVNGAILDHISSALANVVYLLKTTVKKEDLQVERPTLHVLVKIKEVWIIVHFFLLHVPSVMLGKQLSQCCFAGTNVPRDSYVHELWSL